MYNTPSPANAAQIHSGRALKRTVSYLTESAQRIVQLIEEQTGDKLLRPSLHFSAGVVERIERQFLLGCSLIADSNLVQSGIDRTALNKLPIQLNCFLNDPAVLSFAAQRRVTRAEVAVEQALTVKGSKVIVVGSAPMALNRILQLHQHALLSEVVIIAAAAGFPSAVEVKERIWESGLPCIVVRGRKGGANAAIALTNALLNDAARQQL